MNVRRISRAPLLWILGGVVALGAVIFWLVTASAGAKEITTQEGLSLLTGDTVKEVQIIDGEQRVDLTLTAPYTNADGVDKGETLQFYYVAPRGSEVVDAITAS